MGQLIFFTVFVITVIVGIFAYFSPKQVSINPVKIMTDNSAYSDVESVNTKRTQQFSMKTNQGMMQIHKQMDDMAIAQNKLLDSIQDQQQILNNANKDATDIMLATQQQGAKGNQDFLRIQALSAEMQDEQRLLVANGQDLIAVNNQLTKSRQWIADQINISDMNNESTLNTLRQRYTILRDQATGLFDKVTQYNQEVRDRMNKLQEQLRGLENNTVFNDSLGQQAAKERIEHLLENNRLLMQDTQQNLENSKELLNDSLQRAQDSMEDERQRTEDQKEMNQQRIQDQMQRLQDQRNQ